MSYRVVDWFRRKTENPEAVVLISFIVLTSITIYAFGKLLAPILIAIVIAYLLEWGVRALENRKVPRLLAVFIVFTGFIGLSLWVIFGLLPVIWTQLENLAAEIPNMVAKGQDLLQQLTARYPNYLTQESIQELTTKIGSQLGNLGKYMLSISFASLMSIATVLIYMILVPLLVFFFLKDKDLLLGWAGRYFPKDRGMLTKVGIEVNQQIGNYVSGKLVEIAIVGVSTYVVFLLMGMNYSLLLAVLVGLSVLIPYIGAAVVTVPVAIIAYLQWGWTADLGWLLFAHLLIQGIDGNLIVPVLFSEAVSLHPVAIIGAVLIFGGLWGFWGVFFAIPLATLVKALMNALGDGAPGMQTAENSD